MAMISVNTQVVALPNGKVVVQVKNIGAAPNPMPRPSVVSLEHKVTIG
jgi:hypothetical protein